MDRTDDSMFKAICLSIERKLNEYLQHNFIFPDRKKRNENQKQKRKEEEEEEKLFTRWGLKTIQSKPNRKKMKLNSCPPRGGDEEVGKNDILHIDRL